MGVVVDLETFTARLEQEAAVAVEQEYLPTEHAPRCAASTLTVEADSPRYRQMVLVAWSLADNARLASPSAVEPNELGVAAFVLERIRLWAVGCAPWPKLGVLLKRLSQAERGLRAQEARAKKSCVGLLRVTLNPAEHLDSYVRASIELLHARATLEAAAATRLVVRIARGESEAFAELVCCVSQVHARLVAAQLLADGWASERALLYAVAAGASAIDDDVDVERVIWLAACQAIDTMEDAAGEAAMQRLLASHRAFVDWAVEGIEAADSGPDSDPNQHRPASGPRTRNRRRGAACMNRRHVQ